MMLGGLQRLKGCLKTRQIQTHPLKFSSLAISRRAVELTITLIHDCISHITDYISQNTLIDKKYSLPYSVQLWASCTSNKEVYSKEVPVLGNYNQGIPWPNQTCTSSGRHLDVNNFEQNFTISMKILYLWLSIQQTEMYWVSQLDVSYLPNQPWPDPMWKQKYDSNT